MFGKSYATAIYESFYRYNALSELSFLQDKVNSDCVEINGLRIVNLSAQINLAAHATFCAQMSPDRFTETRRKELFRAEVSVQKADRRIFHLLLYEYIRVCVIP